MANPLGSAPSVILGAGLGLAASTALEPIVEPARQTAWQHNRFRILDPDKYAALVAQGAIDLSTGEGFAAREGLASDKFHELVHLAQRTPTYGEAQDLRRRQLITADQLTHTFAKAQIEKQYWDALSKLVDERLSAQVAALAVVRGLMADEGMLPVAPPTEAGTIPPFPVSSLSATAEAAAHGFDKDRLAVLVGIQGRPMGPIEAAQATFRKIIEKVDYQRAIAEGDVRNEWAEAIFEVSRQIPSSENFVEKRLRGWTDDAGMYAGTARHGMSQADTDTLFMIHGRPPSPHQVFIGLRRGGVYDGPTDHIPFPILKAMQESDLRPEWYNIIHAGLETYPSAFVMRALTEGGDITETRANQVLDFEGWNEAFAATVAQKWAAQAGTADEGPWLKKADNQLWTAIHTDFKKGLITAATADSALTVLEPDATQRALIIDRWTTANQLGAAPQPPPA